MSGDERALPVFSPGELLAGAALALVLVVVTVVAAGAWIASAVSGHTIHPSFADAMQAIARLRHHLTDPAAAWPRDDGRVPAAWLYWSCTLAVAAVPGVVGVLVVRRRPRRRFGLAPRERLGVDTEARLAIVEDLAPIAVDGPVAGRFIVGTVHDTLVATEAPLVRPAGVGEYRPARGAVMLVGPTQCGKSTAALCGILEWDGPAVISSVKTDLLDHSFGWRAELGECRVFDPTAITGIRRSSWSPLRGASTIDGALAAARALVDCAPRAGPGEEFWYQEAEMILAGYLWVAAAAGRSMRDVVRWVFTQDAPNGGVDGEVKFLLLEELCGDDPDRAEQATVIEETLEAVWRLEDRMRSSVFGTAQAAVWPWVSPTVLASSTGCDIDLDWLLSGPNTVYGCAPLRAAQRLAPALGGLVGDLLDQVAERVARTGKVLEPPLLIVLDEIGNTPLRDLPEIVSTLSGLGVQLVTVWQSVAQVRAKYRDDAGTILANHRTKVFYSGICDPDTFEYATRLVGDEQVVSRQLSTDLHQSAGDGHRRQNVSENTITTSLVPGHLLRRQPVGSALLIHSTIPPAHLHTRSPHHDPRLRERAAMPIPGRHPTDGTNASTPACGEPTTVTGTWLASRLTPHEAAASEFVASEHAGTALDPEQPSP